MWQPTYKGRRDTRAGKFFWPREEWFDAKFVRMFYREYRFYSNLLLVADVLAAFPALYFSYYTRSYLMQFAPWSVMQHFNPELLPFRDYFLYLVLFWPAWTVLLVLTQRYPDLMRQPLNKQIVRVLQLAVAAGFLIGFFSYTFKLIISRPVFFAFLGLGGFLLAGNRILLHWVLRSRNVNEHNQIKILIVGTDRRAQRVGESLENFKMWGYRVVGYLHPDDQEQVIPELNALGSVRDLPQLLQESVAVNEIIFVSLPKKNLEKFEEMIGFCEDLGIRTRLAADFFPSSTSRVSLEFLDNLPLITFSTVPDHNLAVVAKRVLDFLIASAVLIVLSPLTLAVAVAIKFSSPGPIFYRQARCGLYGRRFTLVKFRTMIDGAEDRLWEIKHLNEMEGPVFKMRNDPRVTPLGHWLRKSSIDELPQVWNVIKGEMSIVGPRAPLPDEVKHYSFKQRRRLSVKPGITCLWQVSGRSDIDFHHWMALDLEYIDNWSFWLDLQIMLKTIPVVFTGKGAR